MQKPEPLEIPLDEAVLTALRDLLEIAETGRSFEENAAIKATAVSKLCREQVVIADDSGLEVDALEARLIVEVIRSTACPNEIDLLQKLISPL